MKGACVSVPGCQRPAGLVPVAHTKPKSALRILENVKELVPSQTVTAVVNVEQARLIQRCDLIRRREMVEPGTRQHPPLALAILKDGIRGPESAGSLRYRQANTLK